MLYLSGRAQITITSNEIPSQTGYKYYEYGVSDSTGNGFPVNVGQSGGPHSWNFDAATYSGGGSQKTTIVDVASTPFSADFPTANLAYLYSADSGNIYFYLKNSDTELLGLGSGSEIQGIKSTLIQEPGDILIKYPFTYGTAWSSDYTDTLSAGMGFLMIERVVSDNSVDAYGTITVPLGTYDCLRTEAMVTTYSLTYFNNILYFSDTLKTIEYTWMGENLGLLASASSLVGETNPDFTMASDVSFRVSGATAIAQEDFTKPSAYSLDQNYPNPFNPTTNIGFTLPEKGTVTISIYNVVGEQVATAFSGNLPAGKHNMEFDAGNLSSGIYFYRIEANKWKATKQMILMK
ncbi:MAG: T9SS type A sorting domain-containing protein [Calditrichia bacterium]